MNFILLGTHSLPSTPSFPIYFLLPSLCVRTSYVPLMVDLKRFREIGENFFRRKSSWATVGSKMCACIQRFEINWLVMNFVYTFLGLSSLKFTKRVTFFYQICTYFLVPRSFLSRNSQGLVIGFLQWPTVKLTKPSTWALQKLAFLMLYFVYF